MTREEAIKEIEKVFEPAFANYIITALTEGATVSDKEPTTENDLGVDAISRKAVINIINEYRAFLTFDRFKELLYKLPSVTPQEPKIVPIAEIKCDEGKLKSMVEIDLYSVIKQKYIERDVLDKIRAEIEQERSFQRTIDEYDIATGLRKALEIIDKYKAKSEG